MDNKILVVEDDDLSRELFRSVLAERGYNVLLAVDGEEALALIEREAPALVLMDMGLPKMSGGSVLKKCEQQGLRTGRKIIALTGDSAETLRGAGFDGVIEKPVRIEELLRVVAEAAAPGVRTLPGEGTDH